jgi:hypothetical protein
MASALRAQVGDDVVERASRFVESIGYDGEIEEVLDLLPNCFVGNQSLQELIP